MTSRKLGQFLIPLPHRRAFYFWGLCSAELKILDPLLPKMFYSKYYFFLFSSAQCVNGTYSEETCENGLVYGEGHGAAHNFCNYNWEVDCGVRAYDDTPISSPGFCNNQAQQSGHIYPIRNFILIQNYFKLGIVCPITKTVRIGEGVQNCVTSYMDLWTTPLLNNSIVKFKSWWYWKTNKALKNLR